MVYKLNPGDKEIFRKARETNNPNYFTDFYIRSEFTGTYWRPVKEHSEVPEIQERIDAWKAGYDKIYQVWKELHYPERFPHFDKEYRVLFDDDPDLPTFHHNHGFLFLPWQLQMVQAPQPTIVTISGFGSGKTSAWLVYMLYLAATRPGFRGLALGPYALQADQVYEEALQLIEGTEYEERFLMGKPTKPYKKLLIGNDLIGKSIIQCHPIGDGNEVDKLKTLNADMALIDQAEMVADIDRVTSVIGSRFRGTVRGRSRMGKLVWSANAEDNPNLWDLYDESKEVPDDIFAISVTTFDNVYNTPKQLINIEKRMGKDANLKASRLKAQRPFGSGEHFPADSIEKMWAKWMDDQMETALAANKPGYKRITAPKAQVVKWEMPPEEGRQYLLIADPGWANPPERNSAPVGVWDITDFPTQPAHLRAFTWVYGNGKPDPWIEQFVSYFYTYRCLGRSAFDATGLQTGYDRWVYALEKIAAEKMQMGQTKFGYLNAAKILVPRGMLQAPNIPMLYSQMSKYRLPDEKLRQDLVMFLIMTAGWLERLWYMQEDTTEYEPPVPESRHGRAMGGRNSRRVGR